ncbi:hypothetical protein CerSpe_087350 [Prunus speciosa]
MLNDPSPSALDSRGAFIVHIPSAIYVWIASSSSSSSSSSSPLYLSPDSIYLLNRALVRSTFQNPLWILHQQLRALFQSLQHCQMILTCLSSHLNLLINPCLTVQKTLFPIVVHSPILDQPHYHKKLSSLAERRGSLSLKLPVMSDKMRLMSTSSKFLSTKEDGVRINDSTCSVGHIDDIDKVLEPKDGVQNGGEDSRQQCSFKVEESEDSVLCLWVGRFFHCGNFPIQLDSGRC